MTMLYYGDERGRVGAHFPFNFDFINSLSARSNARDFVYVVQRWLTYMPQGEVANWVVSDFKATIRKNRLVGEPFELKSEQTSECHCKQV